VVTTVLSFDCVINWSALLKVFEYNPGWKSYLLEKMLNNNLKKEKKRRDFPPPTQHEAEKN